MKRLLLIFTLLSTNSYANCFCVCKNGFNQRVCANEAELVDVVCFQDNNCR